MLPEQLETVEASWWYQLGQTILASLVSFGQFILAEPTIVAGYGLTVLVIAFVLRLIFKSIKIILFFLLIAFTLGYVYITYIDPYIASPNQAEDIFDTLPADQRQVLFESEKALHGDRTTGLLQSVRFGGITKAPDLTGKSYEEGLDILQKVANTFRGEVAYCHFTSASGKSTWLSGTYSNGLTVEGFQEDCFNLNYTKNASVFTHVHTHPKLGEAIETTPPSLLDIQMYLKIATTKETLFGKNTSQRFVVAQGDRVWKISIPNPDKINALFNADHSSQVHKELLEEIGVILQQQNIYACEISETTPYGTDCAKITPAQRRAAVDEILKIYRSWGVEVTEEPRTPAEVI